MKIASTLLVVFAILALTGVTSHAAFPKWNELENYTFEQYVQDFDKPYRHASNPTDVVEFAKRRAVFEDNLKTIKAHNERAAKGLSTYKMGVNHMADWTLEERRRLNGGKARDMAHLPKNGRAYESVSNGAPLPVSVDWRLRAPSVLSAIKDQMMCGDCYVFASVETIESYMAIATGKLYSLSVEQATACTPNPDQCGGTGGCQGGIAELVYDYVKDGLTQEWEQGFLSGNGTTRACHNNTGHKYVYTEGYVKLPANNQTAVMEALATTGPLAVNVDASAWNFYESGIYDGCSYAKNISIDHVVQLVGYGHDDSLKSDYWIIRNSWSPLFGENGFIRLHKSSDNNAPSCGWDVNPQDGTACKGSPPQLEVCGECGILWDTSYPIVNPNKK